MSQNRRKRSRNRNRATTTDVKGQTPQKPHQQKRNEPRSTRSSSGVIQRRSPNRCAIAEAPDPKAVVRSLGRVPLSGHETAAEHWFSLVYERAAVLAGALAAAGGLLGESDEE